MTSTRTGEAFAIAADNASKLFLDGTVVDSISSRWTCATRKFSASLVRAVREERTLLRCIAGLTDISDGKLVVNGKPVTGPPEGVAMVFQHFGLLPWKTVYDNAAFGLAMAGAPAARIKERVSHYLELAGLIGFEQHYPYQLSGGMQQRVGLVRALAINPSILLMDEPFAALDAQTREILQEELLHLMERPEERKTMVFITHSIDEALLLGDRVAVMSARPGRIKEMIDVPFEHPRDVETVRADPHFAELRAHIWRQLHHARPQRAGAKQAVTHECRGRRARHDGDRLAQRGRRSRARQTGGDCAPAAHVPDQCGDPARVARRSCSCSGRSSAPRSTRRCSRRRSRSPRPPSS